MRRVDNTKDNTVKALGFTVEELKEILKKVYDKVQSNEVSTPEDIKKLSDDEKVCLLLSVIGTDPNWFFRFEHLVVGLTKALSFDSYSEAVEYLMKNQNDDFNKGLLVITKALRTNGEGEDKDA